MVQTSLLGWVVEKKRKEKEVRHVYLFLRDLPQIMLPDLSTAGPFKRGDLVTEGMMPQEVWRVLLRRGVVIRFDMGVV